MKQKKMSIPMKPVKKTITFTKKAKQTLKFTKKPKETITLTPKNKSIPSKKGYSQYA